MLIKEAAVSHFKATLHIPLFDCTLARTTENCRAIYLQPRDQYLSQSRNVVVLSINSADPLDSEIGLFTHASVK